MDRNMNIASQEFNPVQYNSQATDQGRNSVMDTNFIVGIRTIQFKGFH